MAFGGFDKGSSAPMAEINTTPLVDVMLVLLVVFIITAPVLSHAIKVDLPQATASEHKEDVKAIRFTIDAEGNTFGMTSPSRKQRWPRALPMQPVATHWLSFIYGPIKPLTTAQSLVS